MNSSTYRHTVKHSIHNTGEAMPKPVPPPVLDNTKKEKVYITYSYSIHKIYIFHLIFSAIMG
jgi:hypothetical protein